MTTYYVGAGGSDAAAGTSWATRWLTGAKVTATEAAGDTVYWGPNTWRELMTIATSGTAGNPITWIGDYDGSHTDGVGGIVRITGAANETTTGTRASCITATSKNYRTFRGFLLDGASGAVVNNASSGGNWIIDQCVIWLSANAIGVSFSGTGTTNAVKNSVIIGRGTGINYTHSATVDNAAGTVTSCMFLGVLGNSGIAVDRVGGVTVSNCVFNSCARGVRVQTALTVGQVCTVNNSVILGSTTAGLQATTTAEFAENYNALHNNSSDRSNVTAGANSVAYPPGFDMRPYFEAFNGGTLVLPLASLASYSGLVEYSAGTGAPSTDWRGHAVAGSLREWGVEEYVSGYGIEAGGGVTMWPLSNGFIQAIIGGGV